MQLQYMFANNTQERQLSNPRLDLEIYEDGHILIIKRRVVVFGGLSTQQTIEMTNSDKMISKALEEARSYGWNL